MLIDQLTHDPATDTYRAYCREGEGEWEWREIPNEDAEEMLAFHERASVS